MCGARVNKAKRERWAERWIAGDLLRFLNLGGLQCEVEIAGRSYERALMVTLGS